MRGDRAQGVVALVAILLFAAVLAVFGTSIGRSTVAGNSALTAAESPSPSAPPATVRPTASPTPSPAPSVTPTPGPSATPTSSPSPVPTPAASPSPTAQSGTIMVDIRSGGYSQPNLVVSLDSSVRWTNLDSINHTVTYLSGPARFDSGPIQPGHWFQVQFTIRGTYTYASQDAPGTLRGTVTVQ